MGQFLDPETADILQFLDPEIMKMQYPEIVNMVQKISRSRNLIMVDKSFINVTHPKSTYWCHFAVKKANILDIYIKDTPLILPTEQLYNRIT